MRFIINVVLAGGFFLLALLTLRRFVRWLNGPRKQPFWEARNKVVLITGASSGIGAELALQYASQGAKLALCARRKADLDKVVADCRARGAAEVLAVQADVSKTPQCEAFVTAAGKQYGVIDCVVLNAGISMGSNFEDVEQKDLGIYRQLMDVNYHGSIDVLHFALPLLKKSKAGKIVVISSIMGCMGAPQRTGYCASKWALHGFFESLRTEITEKYGIEIVMICPGQVDTQINRTRLGSAGKVQELDMSHGNVMKVDEAARRIINATAHGLRQDDMTFQCTLARWARLIAPEYLDKTVVRRLAAIQKSKAQ